MWVEHVVKRTNLSMLYTLDTFELCNSELSKERQERRDVYDAGPVLRQGEERGEGGCHTLLGTSISHVYGTCRWSLILTNLESYV